MGSAHSSSRSAVVSPAAVKVIAADGSLKAFPTPTVVRDVIGTEESFSFVCNADDLYFGTDVPALCSDEALRAGEVYFVLPVEMRGRPLDGSEMASLAVKAMRAMPAAEWEDGGHASCSDDDDTDHDDERDKMNRRLNEETLAMQGSWPLRRRRSLKKMLMKRMLSKIEEIADC